MCLFVKVELAESLAKYEQSMRQISVLEAKISTMEAESQCLGPLRHELQVFLFFMNWKVSLFDYITIGEFH